MDVAGHSTSRFTNKGTLFITDRAVFDTFGEDIMLKDEIKMNMKAKMDVKGLGITFKGLNFDKMVTMNGFNNFTNVMGRTISPLQIFTTHSLIFVCVSFLTCMTTMLLT
mmetsp:Transcript_8355/g.7604  ORF Transcript_8355/g.7604 Transcript_8355/m.7604 type:complete len:109 (+) Transcript_8355:3-329(+)